MMKNKTIQKSTLGFGLGALLALAGCENSASSSEPTGAEQSLEEVQAHLQDAGRDVDRAFMHLQAAFSNLSFEATSKASHWNQKVLNDLNRLQVRWSTLKTTAAGRSIRAQQELAEAEREIAKRLEEVRAQMKSMGESAEKDVRKDIDGLLAGIEGSIEDARKAL